MAKVPSPVAVRNKPAKIWTPRRRFWGNVIPILVWIPLVATGLVKAVLAGEPTVESLYWIGGGTGLAWFMTNWFGLFQNDQMQRELEAHLRFHPDANTEFVGFASPTHGSYTDAHEDVGYLQILPDRLKFTSETRSIQVLRTEVEAVHFRPNVHSLVGLGRWVAIEGTSDGQKIRLTIEPRRYHTLFANLRYSKRLRARIAGWWKSA